MNVSSSSEASLPGVVGPYPASDISTQFTQRYRNTYEWVNACCVDLAIEALNEAEEQIRAAVNAPAGDGRNYLGRAILDVLMEAGLIVYVADSGVWQRVTSARWGQANCEERCREGVTRFPESRAMFDLITLSRAGMVDFLNGKTTGLDVLFPKGDASIWYRYNNENAIIQVYPKLAALGVMAFSKRLGSVRILELGAGTGAGTAEILKVAAGRTDQYIYTDLGVSFIRHGRNRFSDVPFMDFRRLDINDPLIAQGIGPDSMDMIVGINVAHTAKRLESTLDYLRQALKPRGWLVLGEGSPPALERRWKPDLVFALLDGWWHVELTPARPRPGFLMPHEWHRLFEKAGFVSIETLPGEKYFGDGDCYGGAILGKRDGGM